MEESPKHIEKQGSNLKHFTSLPETGDIDETQRLLLPPADVDIEDPEGGGNDQSDSENPNPLQLEIEKLTGGEDEKGFEVDSPILLACYMMMAGFISQFPMFMMLAETEVFEIKFKDYHFGFFVMAPTYASIPYSYLGSRLLSSLNYTTQIHINIIMTLFFMVCVYVNYYVVDFIDHYNSKVLLSDFFFCAF